MNYRIYLCKINKSNKKKALYLLICNKKRKTISANNSKNIIKLARYIKKNSKNEIERKEKKCIIENIG